MWPSAATNSVVRDAVHFIETNLAHDLSTAVIADRLGVSARHLGRLFHKELQLSPARFVRRCRATAAAQLLVGTDLTVETIAARCGFGTAESMRQSFQRTYPGSFMRWPVTVMIWPLPRCTVDSGIGV